MKGFVSLVGGGPGDPGLLTLAGRERLAQAEVVLYDRLVNSALLAHVSPSCELVFAGKSPQGKTMTQEEINALLIEKALAGKRVVRLKGGDPFVFGRGGEEALALAKAGVPFEVVPGVTAAVAVPAYAGVPVTHRGLASSFAVVTAQEEEGKPEAGVDWRRLARSVDTIVVMMGSAALAFVAKALIKGGRPKETPCVSVEWGTLPEQRSVSAPLGRIAEAVRFGGLGSPLVTVIGGVGTLQEQIAWFEKRPLFGRRVLVTRTREQAGALAELLRHQGAVPLEVPANELLPVADDGVLETVTKALEARSYTWCLFLSTNAVDLLFAYLERTGRDARVFAGCRVAALGAATAAALRARGLRAEVTADEFTSTGLLQALPAGLHGARILLPRSGAAGPGLADGLRARGALLDDVIVYDLRPVPAIDPEVRQLLRDKKVDVVTFASSSAVRSLARLLGEDFGLLRGTVVACIGPVTAATAREFGLDVHVQPQQHTVPALVEALVAHYQVKS